ncbi:MAG: hypothetical protein HDR29_04135, partial [Lachnospiraceae bacterium]|nr:hypothetical protein [Lachnospiraceae bacterium]
EHKSDVPAVEENYEIIAGEGDAPHAEGKYVLQISRDTGYFGESTKQDGEMYKTGDEKFFTMIYNSSSKVESNTKKFEDDTEETGRLSFNSAARTTGGSIKFTVTASSRVTVYWQAAGDGREMQILDASGKEVKSTNIGTAKNDLYISKLYLDAAGTYYLGGKGGNNFIFRVEVDNGYTRTRPDWDTVDLPDMEVQQVKDSIEVTVKAKIGSEGNDAEADKVEVTMYDENGEVAGNASTTSKGINPVLVIKPEASGKYRFKAALSRDDVPDDVKYSTYPVKEDEFFQYTLPLSVPELNDVKNMGAVDEAKKYGSVELSWVSVKEADKYIVLVEGKDTDYQKEYEVTSSAILIDKDLEVNSTYIFKVCAQRKATGTFDDEGKLVQPETTEYAVKEAKIAAEYKADWNFVVYGIGTSTDASGFVAADGTKASDSKTTKYSSKYVLTERDGTTPKETVEPSAEGLKGDDVRVWTWGGKGKIVPADTDGLAFYYTTVNPQTTNFTLSANLHVNHWRIGNGQEGFGLLAADRIGENGNTAYHWTNSYTALASKFDYYWDSTNGKVSDSGTKVTLKLGIGSTAKTGVTAANLSVFQNDVTTATTSYYKTETLPLDTSVHTDVYDNIIANENLGSTKSVPNPIEDFKLEIELNATGYFISYIPLIKNADGKTFTEGTKVTNKYYDRNALSMCEENVAYVGFFATRYADVTFSNVKLDTRRYDPTEIPEERPAQEVQLKASVSGASTANNEDYNLVYSANWKGIVSIRDESGALLKQETIEPREGDLEEEGRVVVPVKLHVGDNTFQVTYTPDKDYDPFNGEPYTRLSNYDSKVSTVKVTWKQYGEEGEILYVSPSGKATGDGTKVNPLDIYTAVKYAQPGQTIYLMGGTYKLTKTIKIDRGINGTKDKMIYMLADPETCKNGVRPVFDFNSQCAGIVMAGDWWYYQGFDITRSANQTKGVQVSGNHNTLDGLNIYKNGSTGLQISRLYSSDKTINEWPSYNLVLNCTAYLNADAGYTDADGFAAKLTVGYGNVFDGCISAYNADDGWDLFAKVWTGPIGVVTIKNSVSFENGKVIRDKKTNDLVWFNESNDYEIVNAGSGNGYKMGGSSITGYHTIINSVAFHNKSKGIDCNSCPDIQVYNSISFDNESYNIAMYSNAAVTDFKASGVISYRSKVSLSAEDRIGQKSESTQSTIVNTQEDCVEKIFNNTNFLWNKYSMVSEPGNDFYQHYTTWTTKNAKPPVTSTTVSNDWFKDLEYDEWVNEYCRNQTVGAAIRNADGSINLHGYLELTDKGKAAMEAAGADGAVGLGKSQTSQDANDFLDKVTGGETGGNINTGDAGGEKDDNMDYDDFSQMPGNADEVDLWIAIADRNKVEYTGKAVKPEIHVYSGTKLLKKGKDYTVTYKNNINAYIGAYDDTYYSNNAGIYKYDGVTFDELKASYSSNKDKKPTIIVKAKGNYKNYNTKNVTKVYFDINPVSLTDDAMNRIGINDMALVLKGNQSKVNPLVTFNNKKLSSTKDKDYSFEIYRTNDGGERADKISGSNVSAKGFYKVGITGKNNFAGKVYIDLNVVDGSDKNVLASNFKLGKKIPDKYREGYNAVSADKEEPLPVTLSTTGNDADLIVTDSKGSKLEAGVHYTLSYKNNIDIGTATVIITGIASKGYVGSKEFKFKIVAPTLNKMLKDKQAKLVDSSVLDYGKNTDGMLKITTPESQFKLFGDNHTYQYEGKAVDPVNDKLVDTSNSKAELGLAIKRGNDWYLLVQDKDYKLSYRNNTRQGNASAVFKGIGNYRGSVVQKFKITPFDLDDVNNRLPGAGENVSKIGGTFEIKKNSEDAYVGSVFKDGYNASTKTYTGMKVEYEKGGVKPTVSIRINGNLLKAGRDYSVTYKNNSKVTAANTTANSMPTIIIRGKNGLKGTLKGTFTISKKSFAASENIITVTANDVRISKKTTEGYTGSYKTRIVVKDAKGKTLSAGSDYDSKKTKYELVNNNSYETIKVLGDKDMVTIKNNDNDQYLTIKVTVYPSGNSKYYEGGEAGISTYYRVLYTKNSLRRAKYEVNYSVAAKDDTCFYEPTENNKAFYYYEGGINLNASLLTVKLDGKELV